MYLARTLPAIYFEQLEADEDSFIEAFELFEVSFEEF